MAAEVDVIQHLLDVEHEASITLLDAQKEADRKIAEARTLAESKFAERYKSVVSGIEVSEISEKTRIDSEHAKSMEDYKNSLLSSKKDTKAFDSFMDSILFS